MAGTRPQEISAAKAELQSRQDVLDQSPERLPAHPKTGRSGSGRNGQPGSAATDVQTAKAAVIAQQQHLSLLQEGATVNEIAEARAEVAGATATRDTSTRAAREALNTLLANPRPEDVASARARKWMKPGHSSDRLKT